MKRRGERVSGIWGSRVGGLWALRALGITACGVVLGLGGLPGLAR